MDVDVVLDLDEDVDVRLLKDEEVVVVVLGAFPLSLLLSFFLFSSAPS